VHTSKKSRDTQAQDVRDVAADHDQAAAPARINRRRLLGRLATGAAAASAFPMIIPSRALGLDGTAAPSEKITLGVIGIGNRCKYVLGSMLGLPDVQCVAIADVQESRRTEGKKLVDDKYGNGDCRLYPDFRELLGRKDIDAVLIATGDRWHGPASIMAAEAGKDVYSEKPCGLTIEICQRVADTMRKTGRIYQAGTQRRSVPNFAAAVRLAQSGRLGKVTSLKASVYEPQLGNEWLPAERTPARQECDWNLWLGPAPWRPYNKKYVAGGWRGIYDFDAGARLLDWGAHTVDLCQWANSADETTPLTFEPGETGIECRYANGVPLFLDFLKTPFGDRGPNWNTKLGTCPVKFIGDEGWVETGDAGLIDLSNENLRAEVPSPEKTIKGTDVAFHARNFFECVKSRKATVCNADVMRRSHLACHAASLAWILGRKLSFDPMKEVFTTDTGLDDEANGLCSRPERNPWG
jgi:predicted dehydrogenase